MKRYKVNEASTSKNNGMTEYETFKLNNYVNKIRNDHILSDEDPEEAEIMDSNQVLFHTLLTDPVKRAKVLELLTQQGLVPNDNKSKRGRKKNNVENDQQKALTLFTEFLKSPVSKVMGNNKAKDSPKINSPLNNVRRKFNIESPSALQRRRALQKMESNNSSSESDRSSSQSSETFQGTPVPFEELLKGVIAFVEVRSAEGDRSEVIKSMMKAMGATVRDSFTRDITHVVFRDGSFMTFEKAKLVKAKLVSVLWLDATRRNRFRVPESKYPALGVQAYDYNVSSLCQSMQKDYDEIIRDERRRRSEIRLSHRTTDQNKKRQTMHISNSINAKRNDMFQLDSDSDSLSIHSDIIPSSQTEPTTSFEKRTENKNSNNQRSSFEFTEDESVPNIIIKDSLELKSCLNIRSPDSVKKNNQIVLRDSNENNKNEEESFRLRISDDSNVTNNRKSSTSVTKSFDEINKTDNSATKSIEISNFNKDDNNLIINDTTKNNSKKSINVITCLQTETSLDKNQLPSITNDIESNTKSDDFLSFKSKTKQSIIVGIENVTQTNNINDKTPLTNNKIKEKRKRQIRKTIAGNEISKYFDVDNSKSTNKEVSINEENQCKETINHDISKNENNIKNNINKEIFMNEVTSIPVHKKNYNKRKSVPNMCPTINSNLDSDTVKFVKRRKQTKCITELTRGLDISNEEKKTEDNVINILKENTKNNVANKENNGVTTRKKFRRLFDINQSVDETTWGNQQEQPDLEENDNNVIPVKKIKYNVALPPGLKAPTILTPKAKEYIRKKQTKKIVTSSSEDISPDKEVNHKKNKNKRKIHVPINVQENTDNVSEVQNKDKLLQDKIKSPETSNTNKNENVKRLQCPKSTSDESIYNELNVKKRKKNHEKETVSKTPKKSLKRKKSPKKNTQTGIITQQTDTVSDTQKDSKKLDSNQLFNKLQIKLIGDIAERRSSLEFDQKAKNSNLVSTQKSVKKIRFPGITCTRMHKSNVQVFEQIVKKLGGFIVDDEVNNKTTHLVAGQCSRTINLLKALVRGCWILKQEWLYKSLEAGKWLDEEEYELTEFSPTVQKCRVERQTFGPDYTMDVFKDCGPIYISRGSVPRCSDLEELVTLCNGTIVNTPRQAKIIVGQIFRYENIVCVTEKWVLECITQNKLKSFKTFILEKST